MIDDVNELLLKDLNEVTELPSFVEVSDKCTRQMCRSGVLDILARQPGVHGLGIETVAFLFDEASTVIGELMILVAKLYKEKGLPISIEASVESIQAEEASKFGISADGKIEQSEEEEEKEWQSLEQSQPNKKLN